MNDVLLSVLVITYNQEKYIAQTLESILQQNHKYSYEIIVGEDCSTDCTKRIIEEYVTEYPDIIKPIYNNPNLGLIGNYFNTISKCSGKYIMECAGDDYWLPNKVEKQISFMENNPQVGMCYGKAKVWNESKSCFEKNCIGGDYLNFNYLFNRCPITAASVCFRNDIMKEYVAKINPAEKNWKMEDYPAWLWFCKNSKIEYLDDVFYVYRVIDNSISNTSDIQKQIDFLSSLYDVRKYFSGNDETLLRLAKNLYYEEVAYKYSKIKNIDEYRQNIRKSDSKNARIRHILSYVPFYFEIINLLKKMKKNV